MKPCYTDVSAHFMHSSNYDMDETLHWDKWWVYFPTNYIMLSAYPSQSFYMIQVWVGWLQSWAWSSGYSGTHC